LLGLLRRCDLLVDAAHHHHRGRVAAEAEAGAASADRRRATGDELEISRRKAGQIVGHVRAIEHASCHELSMRRRPVLPRTPCLSAATLRKRRLIWRDLVNPSKYAGYLADSRGTEGALRSDIMASLESDPITYLVELMESSQGNVTVAAEKA